MSIGGRVWGRRSRLELRIGVVCASLVLCGVVAGESVAQDDRRAERRALSAAEREELERAGEESRVREETRERRLASPGERAARERSRSAYRDRGDQAAEMAAREQLGVGQRRWERPENVVQRLGDEVAVVQRENGERAVALSSVPLWTTDAMGREVPVDLSVQAQDGGFGPAASVVDTRFGASVGDGASLDDVVSFAPVVGDRTVEGEAFADKVYYANVGPDPDPISCWQRCPLALVPERCVAWLAVLPCVDFNFGMHHMARTRYARTKSYDKVLGRVSFRNFEANRCR